ncbi:peptidylprolyl isomerase [Salegentibacter chungangensis]|uniref:Peptidyl-prolyl cis-trans isomerase n=1 Tax=Salegentibacter chungangensis TaxID=1335724 RepID=A0ABW3NTQ5_9FLAO
MLRQLSPVFLLLLLVCASCEDTQSSKKNNTQTVTDTTKSVKKEKSEAEVKPKKTEKKEKEKSVDTIFPIAQEELIPFLKAYGRKNPENKVRIKTSFGNIEVELYRDTPLHRANFIMLVKENYFNDTYFHRVAPGFVIQGGNSDNQSTASSRGDIGSYLIPSEFDAGHRHTYGAFSAAKYSEQNVSKASSPFEFFIVMDKGGTPHLNNDHTVFGRVTSGMEVAEKISQVKTGQSEWPINNVHMEVEIID